MGELEVRRLQRAIDRAERTGTAAQLANALDGLATHHHECGRYQEAAPVYRRALGIWRQILGSEHPSVGTLLVNLGNIYLHLDRLDDADPMFKQAITIFEADVDFEDDGVVEAFDRYLTALQRAGFSEDARRLAPRVRRIAQIHATARA